MGGGGTIMNIVSPGGKQRLVGFFTLGFSVFLEISEWNHVETAMHQIYVGRLLCDIIMIRRREGPHAEQK